MKYKQENWARKQPTYIMIEKFTDFAALLVEFFDYKEFINKYIVPIKNITIERYNVIKETIKTNIKESILEMSTKGKISICLVFNQLLQKTKEIAEQIGYDPEKDKKKIAYVSDILNKMSDENGDTPYIKRQKFDDIDERSRCNYYFFDFAAYLDHNKPAEASPDEKEPETDAIQEQTSADNADAIHVINVCEEEKNEEKLADKVVSDLHITSSTLRATFLMLLPFIESRIAEEGSVTAADIVSHFHLPQRTVRDHLTRLVNSGHLTSHGGNRNRRYTSGIYRN